MLSCIPCILASTVDPVQSLAGQFGVKGSLLLAQGVNFCLVGLVLYWFAFKPVLATLRERQQKIAQGLEYTEQMRAKLEATTKEVQAMLRTASTEANTIIQQAKDAAKAHLDTQKLAASHEVELTLLKAKASIEQERGAMLESLRKEITQLVAQTSTQLLSQHLSSDERSRFTEKALAELSMN